MKPNIITFLKIILLLLQVSCKDNKTVQSEEIYKLLSGEYAKLWIFKTDDSLDCHCFYKIFFKTGKMRHVRRDKYSGVFIDYFNNLSGDALNSDDRWYSKSDTLNLMGFNYKLLDIFEKKDTILLDSLNSFARSRIYYLIDAKLINPFSLSE